jgi:hypothetical protein
MVPAVAFDLGLDEAQNSAFGAFADSMRVGLAGLQAACPPNGSESASAPESFARWQQMADAASAALDQAKPPFDAFYASLDESPRATFDAHIGKHGQR